MAKPTIDRFSCHFRVDHKTSKVRASISLLDDDGNPVDAVTKPHDTMWDAKVDLYKLVYPTAPDDISELGG